MKTVNFKAIVGTVFCAVTLAACGGDKDGASSAVTLESKSSAPTSKVIYSAIKKKVVTRGNPARPEQGLRCSIGMMLSNKTKRDISLVQILKDRALTQNGDITDLGTNFRLDAGETTDRAAISVKGVACEDVQKIIIERLMCNYSGVNTYERGTDNCLNEVTVNGTKNIPIEVSNDARKAMITVTP